MLSRRIEGLNERCAVAYEDISITLPVRPNDLDSFGHVNYAAFLEYMEAGPWAWLSHHFRRQNPGKILPVVARLEINYLREARLEPLQVLTQLEAAAESPYHVYFRQLVIVERDGRALSATEARVKMAFMHSLTRSLSTVQAFIEENQD